MFFISLKAEETESSVRRPLSLIQADPVSGAVSAGQRIPIHLDMQLSDGFHGYEDKFKVFVVSPDGTKIGEVQLKPTVTFTDFAKRQHKGFENKFTVDFFIELPADQARDLGKLEFDIEYVACTEKFCLPRNRLSVTIPVVSALSQSSETNLTNESPSSSISASFNLPSSTNIESQIEANLPFALILIFIFGFLTSLTPCVYPLIPITLAVVGARSARKTSQLQAFGLSCFYVLGIATTYSILGVLAAKTGALFGQALSYPPVIIGFSILFFSMALSIFGVFEIALPAAIAEKFQKNDKKKSSFGAYTAGLIAGIVASPCVGPVLVGILAYIAKTQSTVLGFILLFTFAMGMGILFIALGTFSSVIQKVPKSGPWMNFVKYILGSMMLALSLFYLAPLLSFSQYNFALGVLTTTSCAFLYFLTLPQKTKSIVFFLMAVILNYGIVTTKYLKEDRTKDKSSDVSADNLVDPKENSEDKWREFSESLLTQAQREQKPVIIDFYADWCGACVELEDKTFSTNSFKEATQDIYLLRIDATEHFDGLDELQKRFEVYGLPTIVFINSKGEFRKDLSLTGFEDIDNFLKRLKDLKK